MRGTHVNFEKFQRPYPATPWQMLGSINNWERAREFHDIMDTDFDPRTAHYHLGRDFVFGIPAFVPLTLIWGGCVLFAGLHVAQHRPRGLELLIIIIVLMMVKRAVTAIAASMTDDIVSGRQHGMATTTRAIRAWLYMAPFWWLPPFAVGMLMWWLVPIPYFVAIFGHNIYAGTPMIGRFYHGAIAALVASEHYKENGLISPLGELVARHRTVIFDIAGDSTAQFFGFYVLCLSAAAIGILVVGDGGSRTVTAAILGFAALSSLDLLTHAACAVQMNRAYNAFLQGRLEAEPLLRQCNPETRPLYALWALAPVAGAAFLGWLFQ